MTACIAEAQSCIDLSVVRREKSNEKSQNPDNYAILKGIYLIALLRIKEVFVSSCSHCLGDNCFPCFSSILLETSNFLLFLLLMFILMSDYNSSVAAILLKLEKRIAEVPIESKDLGFTKSGPYIYELLADLNITHDTASKLTDIIEQAALLLEEDKQLREKGTVSRLESIGDILKIIFRDKLNAHANSYRVSLLFCKMVKEFYDLCLIVEVIVVFLSTVTFEIYFMKNFPYGCS